MGIGLTWGISWAVIGAAVGFVMRITVPGSVDQGENELIAGAMIGFVGLVSGIGFGILLSFLENRKAILDLSLARVAMWGILGSAALPLLTGMQDKLVLLTCPLGGAFAIASLSIARRAELQAWERQPLTLEPRPSGGTHSLQG
jgi:hypothetical protein